MSARRWPNYGTRAAFGALLLGFFWIFQRTQEDWSAGRPLSSRELAEFAEAAFEWLAVGQALIVLALVPALVAGTVAEERSRRTLPGLLASPLSSVAIILDKLAARMLHVGVILAVGLPIACLLGLLGGVDPRSVVYAYGGTFSTAFFLAALSLLVSVYARGPRGALLLVYLIEIVWLVVPWLANLAMMFGARRWLGALASVNDWILPATPLSLVAPSTVSAWSGQGPLHWLLGGPRPVAPAGLTSGWVGPGALTAPVAWMVALQLAYGATFLLWAAWRLRPVARRLADTPRRRTVLGRVRGRPWSRPACGDDPMVWKERYSQDGGPARFILGMGMLAFGFFVLITHQAFTYRYRLALDEFFIFGYGLGRPVGSGVSARVGFLNNLAGYSVLFYVVALVAVAVESATGVTGEREAGTWDGLLGTPLEPAEIVRAKVLGALVRQRLLLSLVLAPWLFGVALWALHPIGLLLAFVGLTAFLWFAAALGTLFSLRSRTSGQALVRTLGALLVLNLGTLLAGKLLTGSNEVGALFGNTTVLLFYLPLSTRDMFWILTYRHGPSLLFLGILSAYVSAYGVLAWIVSRAATRGFDAAADRPRRMPLLQRSSGPSPPSRLTRSEGFNNLET